LAPSSKLVLSDNDRDQILALAGDLPRVVFKYHYGSWPKANPSATD
jgi:hypothetical protein